MTAAVELFGFLYVNPIADNVPERLGDFRFGRGYFFGAMLRFNDLDLAALLSIGGASLAGAAN